MNFSSINVNKNCVYNSVHGNWYTMQVITRNDG
jgi:hypothetical protein